MTDNSCDRCGKTFKFPYLLKNHKNRKFPCQIAIKEKNIKNTIQILSKNYPKTIQKLSKKNEQKPTKCEDCCKVFTYKCNYYKHRSQLRCKKMKKTEKMDRMEKLKNQVVLKKKGFKNLTINHINNTQNIQNNQIIHNNIINVNAFGKENLESITEQEKLRILNRAFMAFPEALKKIHYDIPENRNFYLPNKRDRQYVKLYNGDNIIYENKEKFNDVLAINIMTQLEGWFDELQKKFIMRRKQLISKMFNEYNKGELENKYNKEIEKFSLTYSSDIKELLEIELLKIKIH